MSVQAYILPVAERLRPYVEVSRLQPLQMCQRAVLMAHTATHVAVLSGGADKTPEELGCFFLQGLSPLKRL